MVVMLRHALKKVVIVLGTLGVIYVLIGGKYILAATGVETQSQETSMYALLSGLNQRMKDESLLITIHLATPTREKTIDFTLGYGYEDIKAYISEIGIDHLCIQQLHGGAQAITCIPYTNISSIDYINN